MSKMDGLRQMRAERYDRTGAQEASTAGQRPAAKQPPVAPPAKPARTARKTSVEPAPAVVESASPVVEPGSPVVEPVETPDELCGHKAISGRTCTRERGHAAKSHRYS